MQDPLSINRKNNNIYFSNRIITIRWYKQQYNNQPQRWITIGIKHYFNKSSKSEKKIIAEKFKTKTDKLEKRSGRICKLRKRTRQMAQRTK